MIGSGLKKLAQENGMKVAHGVAYGSLQGYAATLCEGSGYKQIVFSTQVSAPDALLNEVNQVKIQRIYRVQSLNVAADTIQIVFVDNPGTMKKIREFVEWFIPLLRKYGATGANICGECGGETTNGRWMLINGVACCMHDACAQKVRREVAESEEVQKLERTGSYASGTVGAFLGSVLGAVVWAIVLSLGYMASLVGLLIGWLSEKGYNLLKGKQGKGKIAILIIAIIFGVLLGTFAADAFTIIGMINDGSLYGLSYLDIPVFIVMLMVEDSEYLIGTLGNIVLGLVFAALGVYSLLKKAGNAVSGTKIIDLE